jgi:rod shape-determining protein MreC
MEYSPPPLFKQGAPARLKVTVFACISIALLMADSRVHALAALRQVAGTVLYPLQMAALVPRDALTSMGSYFSSMSAMQKEVRELQSRQVASAYALQQAQLQMAENAHLRKLMGAREHLPVPSMMSEILYDARDSSTRKVVLDRGTSQGVELGLPVIDNAGVVGQVTRVFPFTSEVTLLTDKEQAIPVQVLRNGLRSVAYGRGDSGLLDLRFVAPNADVLVGDVLITSGMDGVYPAGLAVAKVVQVESSAAGAFGRVACQPLAGIDRNRQLLILMSPPNPPQRPVPELPKTAGKKQALPKMAPIKELLLAPPSAVAVPAAAATAPVVGAAAAAAAPVTAAAATTTAAAKTATAARAGTASIAAARAGAANTATTGAAVPAPNVVPALLSPPPAVARSTEKAPAR